MSRGGINRGLAHDEFRGSQHDVIGKPVEERFAEIARYFLESLACNGIRRELYSRPKPGDAREPTEEEVVRRWAAQVHVSVNDICIGIQRAFMAAADSGKVVTSFRWCVPHIVARCNELRDARVGAFGTQAVSAIEAATNFRPRQEVLDRDAARQRARRALGEKE